MDAIEKINYNGKVVIRESGYVSRRNLPEEAKKKLTFQYNKCDRIIVITKGIKKDLVKNYQIKKQKFILINNPVEIEHINKEADKKEKNKEFSKIKNKKIITVGRLEEPKNHQLLLKSFKNVKEKVKDVDLIIVGKGSLENDLKKLADSLQITDSVHFLGFLDNPYYYLKNSDLFVLSSKTEGFPHVLLEAMSLKTPVLSTNCMTGPKDILKKEKYGYLVKSDDVNQLSKKIIKLLLNDKKRKKKVEKAYRRAEQFSPSIIIKKYEKLFEEIVMEN